MSLPKNFIDIQIIFAQKAAKILNISLNKSLFSYTSLPIRFGIPFSQLIEEHSVWQQFIRKINNGKDLSETAFNYCIEQEKGSDTKSQFSDREKFGCFSYNPLNNEKGILIHFANNDAPEPGSLSEERVPVRLAELKAMFADIRSKYPDYKFVASSSWLYNVESFTKLFPPEFIISKQAKVDYRSMGIWGQFIDKYGNTKENLCNEFLKNVNHAKNPTDLEDCFPLKDLKLATDLVYFYKFYKVEDPAS